MELSIKPEHFTSKFLHITINNQNQNQTPNQNNLFFPIIYKTPTLTLNNLLFETPWMEAPFGICQYNNEKDKQEEKYYLDLSFNGYNYDTEIKHFFKVMENIDNYIINFIETFYHNKKETYNYNSQIRYNKNNTKYPPTIKLKIFKNSTKIVDIFEKKIDDFTENIKPNSKIKALIRCNGVWCFENKWGLSWKVCKLSVKQPDILIDYPFIDNNDNDNDTDNDTNTDNDNTE
jgi:hypothetical protein